MLQLQRYAPPPQVLKANHSQREGNTEARLAQLYEKILGLNREWSHYWNLRLDETILLGETSSYKPKMDACEEAMRALRAELKTLVGNDKDPRCLEGLNLGV